MSLDQSTTGAQSTGTGPSSNGNGRSLPTNLTQGTKKRAPFGLVLLFAGIPVLFYAIWSFIGGGSDGASGVESMQSHLVARTPMEIVVVEQGNLESAKNTYVKCMVEGGRGSGGGGGGSTQIIWLYPEGEYVKKGEKIVELDPSGLNQLETEQQILYETARESLLTATNTHKTAKYAVDEYEKGTYPKETQLLEANIKVAKENLRRAQQYHNYSERMFQKGFINKLDLEADEFAVENAELSLKAAETERDTLVNYTKKKMVTELTGARDSAEAAERAAQARFNLEEGKLNDIRKQISNCTLFAPEEGMVIYGDEKSRYRRSEAPQIEEGAVVYFRQTIIRLPDLNDMQVKAKVHESMIERVKKGQKVEVRVDAIANLKLEGEVIRVDNQPEPGHWLSTHIREYAVYVSINNTVKNLKPGMTAGVEILVGKLEAVLQVPVQAAVEKGSETFCYVVVGSKIQERPVVLGDSNDIFIQIKDGLNEGERVILNPRAVVPEARLRGEKGKEEKKKGEAADT